MRVPTVVSCVASAQTKCVSCQNERFRTSDDTSSTHQKPWQPLATYYLQMRLSNAAAYLLFLLPTSSSGHGAALSPALLGSAKTLVFQQMA
ncbi:hypothetical protein CGRA01v4_02468 [Colletotrichum graminicola]|nr:hypothetical protein CGRA01v4_02468 [Colletotrichum graminicola]